MTDLLPPRNRDFHHLVNATLRNLNFAPGLQPLCTADFIEDRSPRPIRVLCLGMPRTGTMSLGAALGMLGYRCYNHIEACMVGERDMKCWNEALDAKYWGRGKRYRREEFGRILKGFDAVADAPAAPYFAEDLIESYPDTKVILTERPVDAWISSIATTVAITFGWPTWRLISWAETACKHWYGEAVRIEQLTHWSDAFSADQRLLRAAYTDYYKRIKDVCPKERLLEFKTGEHGWEELCEFLGHEVPVGVEYPRVNESKTFVPMYASWWWYVFGIAVRKVVARGLVVGAAGWILWRRRRDVPRYWRGFKAFVMY